MNGLVRDLDWNKHIAKLRAMHEASLLEEKEDKVVTYRKKNNQLPKDRMRINKMRTAAIAEKYRTRDPHHLDEEYGDLVG